MRYARRSGRYSCIVNGGKIYQVCNTPFLQPPLLESDLVDGVLEDVNSPSVDDSFVQMFPQECGKSDIKKKQSARGLTCVSGTGIKIEKTNLAPT